jgi:hypothetical protein
MGLHTGEPAVHEEGYVGLDVVRAARICTVGRGGQILLSETTRALLGSALPDGVSVFPLGQRQLRGIDEPERVFEVEIDGLERAVGSDLGESAVPAAHAPSPAVADGDLEQEITRRFEDLGERLAARINERVLGSLEATVGRVSDASGVDDIAARVEAMGVEIDARIRAALEKKVPPAG